MSLINVFTPETSPDEAARVISAQSSQDPALTSIQSRYIPPFQTTTRKSVYVFKETLNGRLDTFHTERI